MVKTNFLAALLAGSLLAGGALAQYVPSSNDRMRVQTGSGPVHTVNAKSYIQTQAGASGGSPTLAGNNTYTGTNTFNAAVTASPANAAVTFSPTGTGTVIINPATASTIDNEVIGGTTPLAGTFTTETDNTALNIVGNEQYNGVTVAKGNATATATVGGTGSPTATLTNSAGSKVMEFTLASAGSATNIVVTPGFTAAHGFACYGMDNTTSTERVIQNTALSTTTATLTFFNAAGTATAPGATDIITVDCDGF